MGWKSDRNWRRNFSCGNREINLIWKGNRRRRNRLIPLMTRVAPFSLHQTPTRLKEEPKIKKQSDNSHKNLLRLSHRSRSTSTSAFYLFKLYIQHNWIDRLFFPFALPRASERRRKNREVYVIHFSFINILFQQIWVFLNPWRNRFSIASMLSVFFPSFLSLFSFRLLEQRRDFIFFLCLITIGNLFNGTYGVSQNVMLGI